MATGDFELYVGDVEDFEEKELIDSVADFLSELLDVRATSRVGGMRHLQGAHATAQIGLYPADSSDWPVYRRHPCYVVLHYLSDCEAWRDSKELALHVFHSMDALEKYELLLVHDEEQYVCANFKFHEMGCMQPFKYWSE